MKEKFLSLFGAEDITTYEISSCTQERKDASVGITVLYGFALNLGMATVFNILFHETVVTVVGMGVSVLLFIVLDFMLSSESELSATKKRAEVFFLCLAITIFVCYFVSEMLQEMLSVKVYVKGSGVGFPGDTYSF